MPKGSKRISLNTSVGQNKNTSMNTSFRATQSTIEYRKLFSKTTKAIVWGMQTRAVQSMLDFDFICRREEPSVVAMVRKFKFLNFSKFLLI
jgi:ATP citrate (pro-S)-lyase